MIEDLSLFPLLLQGRKDSPAFKGRGGSFRETEMVLALFQRWKLFEKDEDLSIPVLCLKNS